MKEIFIALGVILMLFHFRTVVGDYTPINKIQVIGSHNSYKKSIDPVLFKLFAQKDSSGLKWLDYEHISLTDQLTMGLCNLELDVYSDSDGGRFAHPIGLDLVKEQPPYDPKKEMRQPGFKVFHMIGLDFRSHCLTFKDGLRQLKKWSETNPRHYPVFITIEPKDEASKIKNAAKPEPFTSERFDALDKELLAYLGKDQIITPDQVRGDYATLEDAVLHNNWPTVGQARGKFLFLLDARDPKMAMYMKGHPSLKGRVLFTNADPGTPEAAMMFRNDPRDPEIARLVTKGYIIRTRADADTKQARSNDYSMFIAAQKSGAQIITTDYYLKSTHFNSDYVVRFDGDFKYIRENPILR